MQSMHNLSPVVSDLLVRRSRLHAELTMSYNPDPQWWSDRVDEMAHLNRELKRLGVIPQSCVC